MKILKIAFPIVLMLVFILIMNASFFFHPYINSVPERINDIEESVINGDWHKANEKTNELIKDIRKNKFPWMQFSIERQEMNNILLDIYELKGSIKIMDTASAINSIYGIKANWNNLGG